MPRRKHLVKLLTFRAQLFLLSLMMLVANGQYVGYGGGQYAVRGANGLVYPARLVYMRGMVHKGYVPTLAYMGKPSYAGSRQLASYVKHREQVVPVKSYGYTKPTHVTVQGGGASVYLNFVSRSSLLVPQFHHVKSKGSIQRTYSVDEPHRLVHTVTRPVIQEVYEVIRPQRRIVQRIEPLQQEITTLVHRDGGAGFGGGTSGGYRSNSGNDQAYAASDKSGEIDISVSCEHLPKEDSNYQSNAAPNYDSNYASNYISNESPNYDPNYDPNKNHFKY